MQRPLPSAIFHMRDVRRNVLPKFIEICMEMPEINEKHMLLSFATKARIYPRGTRKQ